MGRLVSVLPPALEGSSHLQHQPLLIVVGRRSKASELGRPSMAVGSQLSGLMWPKIKAGCAVPLRSPAFRSSRWPQKLNSTCVASMPWCIFPMRLANFLQLVDVCFPAAALPWRNPLGLLSISRGAAVRRATCRIQNFDFLAFSSS